MLAQHAAADVGQRQRNGWTCDAVDAFDASDRDHGASRPASDNHAQYASRVSGGWVVRSLVVGCWSSVVGRWSFVIVLTVNNDESPAKSAKPQGSRRVTNVSYRQSLAWLTREITRDNK